MATSTIRESWEGVCAAEARLWAGLRAMVEREGLRFRGAERSADGEVVLRIVMGNPDTPSGPDQLILPGLSRAEAVESTPTTRPGESDPTAGLPAITARPGDDLDALIARDPEQLRVTAGDGHCAMVQRLEGEALQCALCTTLIQDAVAPRGESESVDIRASLELARGWYMVEIERRELVPDREGFLRAAAAEGCTLDTFEWGS